ncbi:hypothetical protein ACROYT_G005488 [Oculina patagonica]
MANRDFRKVNIPRACHDIVNPVVPFALRLSSHLMIGVVRIYHEQTKTVWVEVAHMWRTIKKASGMRASEIDLINPALREEAITDPLDLSTESFRLDLEVHSVALIGLEAYFTVNGNGHPSPVISPPPPMGQFSPPSIPGTPEQHGTPGWLPHWRPVSDHERSPIKIQEINHLQTSQDEPIKIPGEVDITGEEPLPDDLPLDHTGDQEARPHPTPQTAATRPSRPRSRSRSKSPRRKSRSRSRSPHRPRRSHSRSPQRPSSRPKDVQPTKPAAPISSAADLLDEEPSLANVLIVDQNTAQLVLPQAPDEDEEIPTTVTADYQAAVPTGLATPGVPITTATPSPPKKRRRLAIDRNTKMDADVIRQNMDTEGQDTLCERSLDEHPLKSAKDLFMEPVTEALLFSPFLDLWKRNAVTTPVEYSSSESGGSGEESPLITNLPIEGSIEVGRHSMETPSEKEIARKERPTEGSGLFEHSAASDLDFTPILHDSGLKPQKDLSASGDQDIQAALDLEQIPHRRPSSLLHSSITGLLSPIQEPSDFDELEEIELSPLKEQPEVEQPLEEQARETWRLVSKAMGDSGDPVVFRNFCPPHSTERKTAAKVFYHLLALHKNGLFELKQRDPYNLTNIYIHKGKNF